MTNACFTNACFTNIDEDSQIRIQQNRTTLTVKE